MADTMSPAETPIDDAALDSLSVAPPDPDATPAQHPNQNAGQDASIAERLRRDPQSADAKLDCGLDESMDASDPPSTTQPGRSDEPAPSTGYNQAAEDARAKP